MKSNQVLRAIHFTLKTSKLKQESIALGKNGWDQNDRNVRQAQQSRRAIKPDDYKKHCLNGAQCRITALERKNTGYHYASEVQFWFRVNQQLGVLPLQKYPTQALAIQTRNW